ncbi:MAG: alpha/beta hydrolase [Balneolaceae bacterium]|nr:MAG: alpha/beta hydrolase [Balneolaceae bacterium]
METVISKDGTEIAFKRTGSGPSLVLVHGSAGDHTRWELFDIRPTLSQHFTVYAIDRRGRSGSGDVSPYMPEREFEDVAAVADSINEPVTLLGHSYGAFCALGASLITYHVHKLILYEPVFRVTQHQFVSDDVIEEMEILLAKGNNEKLLELFLKEVARISRDEIEVLRSAPNWQTRVDAAHTLLRETVTPTRFTFDPGQFADMTTPTLLLTGSESPAFFKEVTRAVHDMLPNSRIESFQGHGHVAMNSAPDLFVEKIVAFAFDMNEN